MAEVQKQMQAKRGYYVLRDVPGEMLSRLKTGMTEVYLKRKEGVPVSFVVDTKDVLTKKKDARNPSFVRKDVLLTEDAYDVSYQVPGTHRLRQTCVPRSVIWDWYYGYYSYRPFRDHDLQYVLLSSLGPLQYQRSWRTVMWNSAVLHPGTPVLIEAEESEILFVPKRKLCGEDSWLETGELEPYVHLDLAYDSYPLFFKNKETDWKIQMEMVKREELVQDYMQSQRAQIAGMNPMDWMNQRDVWRNVCWLSV